MGLRSRHLRGELMDDPALNAEEHVQALNGLRRINTVTNSYSALWKPIRDLARQTSSPLRVLELACGSGDNLLTLKKRALRENLNLELTGLDLSPTAIQTAKLRSSSASLPIEFMTGDALWTAPAQNFGDERFDVVYCSLFLHHLSNDDAVRLLTTMKLLARRLVLVSDLLRTTAGYLYAFIGTRLLSRSYVVHTDGPRSVEAAFSLKEVQQLSHRAGLGGATVHRFWPERYLLRWESGQDESC